MNIKKLIFALIAMAFITTGCTNDTNRETKTKDVSTTIISEAEAKKIAFDDTGIQEEDVTYIYIKLDYDDGKQVYEIEFRYNNTEYDYEIDAVSGKIISYDNEMENINNSTNQDTSSSDDIGINKAKEIALAKVAGASENDIKIKQDYDDGIFVYEGTIYFEGMEYDFEINAKTGEIISWDMESIYD